ncbi:type 1 glutamine amidotransferase [uncultured Pseudokineococcus sp.]|uniref:type 1 glutamine amidotransferase n=1 Tax=uncultured Pseudokineococcus sp. TaxID=1642928 RepID=UPI0026062D9D|nr:type 1 glutamine amidotransferase [uncultured Pseudokineococcus sp.]
MGHEGPGREGTGQDGAGRESAGRAGAGRESSGREVSGAVEPLRVLVVQHEDVCPPAVLGDALVREGAVVDVVRPDLGQPLPSSLGRRGAGRRHGGHDALVVLGGTAAADDDARWPWLPAVRALLAACVADGTPVLGVCLGAQLLARATGGRTGPAPRGPEHGVLSVLPVDGVEDDLLSAVGGDGPWRAVQSHGDAVLELPAGGELLATSTACDVQVFRVWRARGVQYHPEATAAVVAAWCDDDDVRRQLAAGGLTVEGVVGAVADAEPELAEGARRHARVLLAEAAAARAERSPGAPSGVPVAPTAPAPAVATVTATSGAPA